MRLTRHRCPEEPRRGRPRPREAQLGACKEGHGQLNVARVAAHPRPGEGAQHVGQGRRARERGTQKRRERPGLPGADGNGERPVLQAQAIPVALHGDVAAEPPGLP